MRDQTSVKGKLLSHKSASTVETIDLQSVWKKYFEQLAFDYYFLETKVAGIRCTAAYRQNTASIYDT